MYSIGVQFDNQHIASYSRSTSNSTIAMKFLFFTLSHSNELVEFNQVNKKE
jgi:hypothetical protein